MGAEGSDKTFELRSDEVSQFGGDPADALREAPEKEAEFLKVPRINVKWFFRRRRARFL